MIYDVMLLNVIHSLSLICIEERRKYESLQEVKTLGSWGSDDEI